MNVDQILLISFLRFKFKFFKFALYFRNRTESKVNTENTYHRNK